MEEATPPVHLTLMELPNVQIIDGKMYTVPPEPEEIPRETVEAWRAQIEAEKASAEENKVRAEESREDTIGQIDATVQKFTDEKDTAETQITTIDSWLEQMTTEE